MPTKKSTPSSPPASQGALVCGRIPGRKGLYCRPANVARAAGVNRQAVVDSMRRGALPTVSLDIAGETVRVIAKKIADAYVARSKGRKNKPGKRTTKVRKKVVRKKAPTKKAP